MYQFQRISLGNQEGRLTSNRRLSRTCTALGSLLLAATALAQTGGQSDQPAQPPAASLTADQLRQAAKRYFRDTTELPLLQQMSFTVFDSAGRSRKTQKLTLEYLFHGYNPGSETARVNLRGNVSFWSVMRGNKMAKASINSATWTVHAGIVARNFNSYSFNAGAAGDGRTLAKLAPKEPCPVFAMNKNAEIYFPDGYVCGPTEFQLDRDLGFERFAYEASGLPAISEIYPLGHCTLQRYHTEIEFQTVTIPGDKEPFLLPKRVTTTLETNKGNVVIHSEYEPKPPGGSSVH